MLRKETTRGLTLYFNNDNALVDIDVESDVTELHFFEEVVSLENINKQFPNVTEIVLHNKVRIVCIRNNLFPNVRHVKTVNNRYFADSSYLVTRNGELLNTFCLKENVSIDFSGIKSIGNFALEGCMSTKGFNTQDIYYCSKDSIKGYLGRPSDGYHHVLLGDILVYAESCDGVLDIPYETRIIAADIDYSNVHKIIIHSFEAINVLCRVEYLKFVDEIELDTLENCKSDRYLQQRYFPCKKLSINSDNPYYASYDGILYTKDMQKLLRCPSERTGTIIINDGTTSVLKNAFYNSKITDIYMPDTLLSIGQNCFMHCKNLNKIHFGNGLRYIPTRCFSHCTSLHDVTIPGNIIEIEASAFQECPLEKLELNYGLLKIWNGAFIGCSTKTVKLPKSVQYIGLNAFSTNTECIILETNRFPENLASGFAVNIVPQRNDVHFIKCITPECNIIFPKYMNISEVCEIDDYLSLNTPDNTFIESLLQYETENKQVYALLLYKETGSMELLKYIKRVSTLLARKLIEQENLEMLVYLLKLNVLSQKSLQSLVHDAQKKNNATVVSYLLNAIFQQ